jgi:cell division protein FtsW
MMAFSRTERGLLARWWWTVDHGLLAGLGLLAASGLVFVLASSPGVADASGCRACTSSGVTSCT